MKYCVPYKRNFKYIDEIDELDIRYKKEDTKLLEFLKKFGENKRVNIQINYDELENNLEFFKALRKSYPKIDFALVISSPYWKNYSHVHQKLGEHNIKFFFIHEINNWDELHGYLNLKPCPCDVIITEDLCFQLKDVAELVHSKGVRVRTYANVGQSTWNDTPALKKFFIRPEDIYIYEDYIDVINFWGKEESVGTYYKIYAIDKKWFGKLNEIILSLDTDIDSRFLLPSFAKRRLNCGKRCLKGKSCQICEATEQLSATLEKHNLMISDFEK